MWYLGDIRLRRRKRRHKQTNWTCDEGLYILFLWSVQYFWLDHGLVWDFVGLMSQPVFWKFLDISDILKNFSTKVGNQWGYLVLIGDYAKSTLFRKSRFLISKWIIEKKNQFQSTWIVFYLFTRSEIQNVKFSS